MITKHNATTRYGWKMAMGIGLVGATAVLIAAIMFADRAGTPVAAASLRLPASIRTLVADLANALGFGEVVTPMRSSPLGIDLPYGADVRDLPRGLTDYIRPGSVTPVVHTQSSQLGIDLPYGADVRTLPRGLTDYIRPGSVTPVARMQSAPLGIDLPYGADVRTLPRGLSDYIHPQHAETTVAASSAVLGITMPTGARYSDLPRGVTDYLRASK